MNQRYLDGLRILAIAALPLILPSRTLLGQQLAASSAVRRTLAYHGLEREYFVHLPPSFDRGKPYWLLVVMGAVNGRNNFHATGISRAMEETAFEAIVVSPSSPDEDLNAIRF